MGAKLKIFTIITVLILLGIWAVTLTFALIKPSDDPDNCPSCNSCCPTCPECDSNCPQVVASCRESQCTMNDVAFPLGGAEFWIISATSNQYAGYNLSTFELGNFLSTFSVNQAETIGVFGLIELNQSSVYANAEQPQSFFFDTQNQLLRPVSLRASIPNNVSLFLNPNRYIDISGYGTLLSPISFDMVADVGFEPYTASLVDSYILLSSQSASPNFYLYCLSGREDNRLDSTKNYACAIMQSGGDVPFLLADNEKWIQQVWYLTSPLN